MYGLCPSLEEEVDGDLLRTCFLPILSIHLTWKFICIQTGKVNFFYTASHTE